VLATTREQLRHRHLPRLEWRHARQQCWARSAIVDHAQRTVRTRHSTGVVGVVGERYRRHPQQRWHARAHLRERRITRSHTHARASSPSSPPHLSQRQRRLHDDHRRRRQRRVGVLVGLASTTARSLSTRTLLHATLHIQQHVCTRNTRARTRSTHKRCSFAIASFIVRTATNEICARAHDAITHACAAITQLAEASGSFDSFANVRAARRALSRFDYACARIRTDSHARTRTCPVTNTCTVSSVPSIDDVTQRTPSTPSPADGATYASMPRVGVST
jgi:hypothetical protein